MKLETARLPGKFFLEWNDTETVFSSGDKISFSNLLSGIMFQTLQREGVVLDVLNGLAVALHFDSILEHMQYTEVKLIVASAYLASYSETIFSFPSVWKQITHYPQNDVTDSTKRIELKLARIMSIQPQEISEIVDKTTREWLEGF